MIEPEDICEIHCGCMATGYYENGEKVTGHIFIDDYLFDGENEWPIYKLESMSGEEIGIFAFEKFIVSGMDEE